MIYLYSGTPGSGKSLHATADIIDYLRAKKRVICNYAVDLSGFNGVNPKLFRYVDNSELTPQYLTDLSIRLHKNGKIPMRENQVLVVIDECSIMMNCRDFSRGDRSAWVTFFMQHRKLGYNIILISQFDRMIDKQIRGFIEYECMHRKLNNAGGLGFLFKLFRIPVFYKVERWYHCKSIITSKGAFNLDKKVCNAYNSFLIFE